MNRIQTVMAGILGFAMVASAKPIAVVEENTWDFGKVPNFGHVAHTFTIHNKGDAGLRIDSVIVECGCTTTDLKATTIPPGGHRNFQVGFNAGVLPNGGLKTERAKIYTNDPQAGMLTCSLTIQVVAQGWELVEVSPTVLEINGQGQAKSLIQVKNKTDEPLKISVMEASGFLASVGARTKTVESQASVGFRLSTYLPKGVDTRGPVPRLGGRAVHSSVTLVATGLKGNERFTIPSELVETARARRTNVEPN